jgi:hypothetical protein
MSCVTELRLPNRTIGLGYMLLWLVAGVPSMSYGLLRGAGSFFP